MSRSLVTSWKISPKIDASTRGTTIATSRAQRLRSRCRTSLPAISSAVRTVSVPQRPAGQVQEDGLEVRLVDLDGLDRDTGARHGAHQLWQQSAGAVDDQIEAAVAHARRPHPGDVATGAGRGVQVTDSIELHAVVLADECDQLRLGALGLELSEVDDPDPVTQPLGLLLLLLLHVVRR